MAKVLKGRRTDTIKYNLNDRARLAKYTAFGSQAAEQNPIDRYADQVGIIHCINMPNLEQ